MSLQSNELNEGASDKSDRAVVNGASEAVSAVPASIPSAVAVHCEYLRQYFDESHHDAANDMERMALALIQIAHLGREKPGHGYSCATIAINTLEKINDQDA